MAARMIGWASAAAVRATIPARASCSSASTASVTAICAVPATAWLVACSPSTARAAATACTEAAWRPRRSNTERDTAGGASERTRETVSAPSSSSVRVPAISVR